jgi:predicted AAA+ superfamily ATPase
VERYLQPYLYEDSQSKIVLISGPRQSGKTTLSKQLFQHYSYLNYDVAEDRLSLAKKEWPRSQEAIIFDELHKMPNWKRWLKGIFDTEGVRPRLLVTGSANMDAFSKVGDSLAGRYFHFRLHPIDLKEAILFWNADLGLAFEHLIQFGGFPEPFLKGTQRDYRRWQKTHLDIILRQDFLDLYAIRSIQSIELLIELLKPRTASSVSYHNLSVDLQVDPKTIKTWLQLLENFYLIFRVTPYHHNIARSLLKEPKFYFFDIARVPDKGARLENLVATALLKEIHFIEDTEGVKAGLHYLRTKDGHEIDFLITIDEKPVLAIEVKSADDRPSKSFHFFRHYLKDITCIQLVLHLKKPFDTPQGIQVKSLIEFLSTFDLKKYF